MYLSSDPIDLPSLLDQARPSDGGICLFVGVVRKHGEGRETTRIEYEAYAAMAEAEIEKMVRSIGQEWPQARLWIRHRLGRLSPGEAAPLAPAGGNRPGLTEGAWNNLGMYEMETRRNLSAARLDFEESLKLNPAYSSPMYNLALLSREKGDARTAEDWLFRALAALKSNPAVAVGGWAREYQRDEKVAAARSLLERAAKTYPDNEVVARERALLLYRQKDCPGAVAALARFEASTTEVETLNDLALFETCLANREAVTRLLERSLAIKPEQPGVARSLEMVRRASSSP